MILNAKWIRIGLFALLTLLAVATSGAVAGECLSIGTQCGCPDGSACF